MRHEFRTGEIRAVGDGRDLEILAVAYNVVDDYNTRFVKGVFNKGLQSRLPKLAWAHNWDEPIGRITDWRDEDDGLYVTARLSDPEAVPRARQAIAQVRDGDINDVSVGFMRKADKTNDDGVVDITEAELDEVSLVLRGAVPGARILATRSGKVEMIDKEQAASILVKYEHGDFDLADALVAIKEATFVVEDDEEDDPDKPKPQPPTEVPEQEPEHRPDKELVTAVDAPDLSEVDAVLAKYGA